MTRTTSFTFGPDRRPGWLTGVGGLPSFTAVIPDGVNRAAYGHRDVKATLTVQADPINTDDHSGNMAALGALATPTPSYSGNLVALHG